MQIRSNYRTVSKGDKQSSTDDANGRDLFGDYAIIDPEGAFNYVVQTWDNYLC